MNTPTTTGNLTFEQHGDVQVTPTAPTVNGPLIDAMISTPATRGDDTPIAGRVSRRSTDCPSNRVVPVRRADGQTVYFDRQTRRWYACSFVTYQLLRRLWKFQANAFPLVGQRRRYFRKFPRNRVSIPRRTVYNTTTNLQTTYVDYDKKKPLPVPADESLFLGVRHPKYNLPNPDFNREMPFKYGEFEGRINQSQILTDWQNARMSYERPNDVVSLKIPVKDLQAFYNAAELQSVDRQSSTRVDNKGIKKTELVIDVVIDLPPRRTEVAEPVTDSRQSALFHLLMANIELERAGRDLVRAVDEIPILDAVALSSTALNLARTRQSLDATGRTLVRQM